MEPSNLPAHERLTMELLPTALLDAIAGGARCTLTGEPVDPYLLADILNIPLSIAPVRPPER